MAPSVEQLKHGISIVAKEYPLKRVDLFGSLAIGAGTSSSDVDLLVEFLEPRVSLLTLNQLKCRLEALFGSDVDVIHGPLPENSMIEITERISLYGT